MARKVKISRERVKKGILTEVEIPGVVFDGMEPDDTPVFYIKQISRAYADVVQARIKDTTPENFFTLVDEIIVENLVDDEGNPVFDNVAEIPYTFTLAAWRPVLKAAFDIEFRAPEKDTENEAGVEADSNSGIEASSDTQYGPNGADSSSGDLSANPFTQTLEGDSSTG